MLRRTSALIATFAATAVTLTACNSDGSEQSLDNLEGALAMVPATEESLTLIAWTDISAAAELGAYEEFPHPFATAGLIGYGGLANDTQMLDPALQPATDAGGSAALSVGRPPDTAFRWDGLESAAVEEFFAAADGDRNDLADGTLLVRRDDHATDMSDDFLPPGVLAQMNTVWFGGSTLVGSTTQAQAISLVEGADETAADSSTYAGITDCLGDVVAAELHATDETFGVGFGGTAEAPVTSLCIRADDPDATADTVRETLASGVEPTRQQPWSELLGSAEVAVAGDWVQVRLPASDPPDVIYHAVVEGQLPVLLGEDPATVG